MLNENEMQPPVVYFDGVCNLCNGFVDWLVRHDTAGVFKIAALQGETARRNLPEVLRESMKSVILTSDGRIYEESAAMIHIAKRLPAPWSIFIVFLLVPAFIRDPIYRFVASNRYRWFGQRETCRLPTPAERSRFLD